MTSRDLRQLARLASQLANELDSRAASPVGNGALVQGDDQCIEKEPSESMDPTNTEPDGASSSLQQTVHDAWNRLRRSGTPARSSPKRNGKPRDEP